MSNSPRTADYWIEKLNLTVHPEGGAFAEVYRSELILPVAILPAGFAGDRPASTSIYFLLRANEFSAFHRIPSDELWHFYTGGPLEIFEINPAGKLTTHRLGPEPAAGESFQCRITAGSWFASRPASGTDYALLGCTVAPGFDFEDFELGEKSALLTAFPQHKSLIEALCQ